MSESLIEWWHQGKTFIGTPQQLADELTYSNYRYNRKQSPDIAPEAWKPIFGSKVDQMELRYRQELIEKLDGGNSHGRRISHA